MRLTLFQGIPRPLRRSEMQRDVVAGVTAASANIPQVLGYSAIAGMPIVAGLYTVFLPLIAFAMFGASRRLVVAADSATAALVSGSVASLAAPASERYVALVGMLVLLVAAMLLLARLFRLGFLADFLSRTVLVGFLSGVGVQVAVAMLGGMTGLDFATHRTLPQMGELAHDAARINLPTLALAGAAVAAILLGRRLAPRMPVALAVVLGSIAASAAFDFAGRGIAVVGAVPGGLPTLRWPAVDWHDAVSLLPVAASCVAMIVAQSAATARSFAERHQERVDANGDLLGLSAANAMAALSGSFVVNGSPSQTAIAENAGARSQVAMLAIAGVSLLVLLFLTGPLAYLPRCVLAAIVFTIAVGMIDFKGLAAIQRESRGEFRLALFTAAAVVVVGVEPGILLAIVLSLLRHVRHSYEAHSAVLVRDAAGHWEPRPAVPGVQTAPGVVLYRFGADLFYANADRFADGVRAIVRDAPQPVRWLVIDAGAITALDYSAACSLRELIAEFERGQVTLVFARVTPDLRADMERHRIVELLGAARVLPTLHEALTLTPVAGPARPRP